MNGMLFDARQHTPQQGGGTAHPVGNYDAQINDTCARTAGPQAKDPNGVMFVVEFTTPAGKIEKRYNVKNQSVQAVEIANKELAALCYAVGIFNISAPTLPNGELNMPEVGKEMRGARLKIDVGFQIDKETKQPSAYTEVKKVFDIQGNEPGKAPAPQPQPQQTQAPMQQNGQGGWGSNAAAPQSNAGGWSQNAGAGTVQAPPWGR